MEHPRCQIPPWSEGPQLVGARRAGRPDGCLRTAGPEPPQPGQEFREQVLEQWDDHAAR